MIAERVLACFPPPTHPLTLVSASCWVEGLSEELTKIGYTVFITSDHGHVEALGLGQRSYR
jgi:hypothetical protein